MKGLHRSPSLLLPIRFGWVDSFWTKARAPIPERPPNSVLYIGGGIMPDYYAVRRRRGLFDRHFKRIIVRGPLYRQCPALFGVGWKFKLEAALDDIMKKLSLAAAVSNPLEVDALLAGPRLHEHFKTVFHRVRDGDIRHRFEMHRFVQMDVERLTVIMGVVGSDEASLANKVVHDIDGNDRFAAMPPGTPAPRAADKKTLEELCKQGICVRAHLLLNMDQTYWVQNMRDGEILFGYDEYKPHKCGLRYSGKDLAKYAGKQYQQDVIDFELGDWEVTSEQKWRIVDINGVVGNEFGGPTAIF